MTFDKCALVGYPLKPENIQPIVGTAIEYEIECLGKVKITFSAYNELLNGAYERYLIAGICKNRTLNNLDPILIDQELLTSGYKKHNPPIEFDEKCTALLKVLYLMYGKENRLFELNSTRDFALAYADQEEFTRIVDQLKTNNYIDIRTTHNMGRDSTLKLYIGVKVTNTGKSEAKKGLPKMPLVGLVNQTITTGDNDTDEKINHARELFFSEPKSMDKMRSACETLSYILEPLREDLKNYFSTKDVSDFFQLVNTFDIRHNKDTTKSLIHEEQLEWVFYSLLNSINTYTKLKNNGK